MLTQMFAKFKGAIVHDRNIVLERNGHNSQFSDGVILAKGSF